MRTASAQRTKPSFNLLAVVAIVTLAVLGYVAVIWSAEFRGYSPSKAVAVRDLTLFAPLVAVFIWLVRRQRFRGELVPFTAAILLFAFGMLTQYRLFSDPEYGARGVERTRAREIKTQTLRLRSVSAGYDVEKKALLFGQGGEVPEKPAGQIQTTERTAGALLTSVNTLVPIGAALALAAAFILFRNDRVLLFLQKHSLAIGLATLVPFAALVIGFADEGKFLGQTTPWEPVKVLFLVSFAGALSASYRRLGRTRWGLPPFRYVVPFAVITALPILPFFALSDFGQMLVFFGVYFTLYMIAVRKKAQLVYALAMVVIVFGIFFATSGLRTGFGVPGRVYQRFHMWTHTWEPPDPAAWWWKRDFERYLKAKNLTVDMTDQQDVAQRNSEAWSDRAMQLSQGIFGVNNGRTTGAGFGLGFPETIPVSDSDFVYAAAVEETGLIGGLVITGAIAILMLTGVAISLGSADMFTKLIAAGLTCFFCLQAIINIAGELRMLPMTGITLPFVSHGGWSLITSFAMLGMLLALSHRNATAAPRSLHEAEMHQNHASEAVSVLHKDSTIMSHFG
ncbi:MAG TPA: FtsW/RodA/SpoVE family cell cycle protein [Blastocatellia bacterium]|nr:FtsW/RodA/SpoVE family cell cycle protein [Blastocatellia bacterium]